MLKTQYFVLNPKSSQVRDACAIASRAALRKYADWIEDTDPELAEGLRLWVNDEAEKALEFYRTEEKMCVKSVTFAPVKDKVKTDG